MKEGLSLVIPVYDEAQCLVELVARCVSVCRETGRAYEIVLVDDGSEDDSRTLIRAAASAHAGRVRGVFLNRNYGQHAAVMAGLAEAVHGVVVTLDADLQNPPEEIPKLLARIDDGCDAVGSVRRPRNDSLARRCASWLVNTMVRRTTGVAMSDHGCMLRAYRRPVVDAILACHERSTFIPVLANCFAARPGEVVVRHDARGHAASRYTFWKLLNLQFDLLTSITTFPIRLLNLLGVVLSAGGVGFGVLLAFTRVVYGAEWAGDGVFTVLAVLFVLVGVQLFGMGLLGEYIGRIYADVRGRPRYHISERVDSSEQGDSSRVSDGIPARLHRAG